MPKSTHSPEYKKLCQRLRELREDTGLSQRDVAERLGVAHSQVANIELGERRIDFIELIWLCQALDLNPAKTIGKLAGELS